MKWYQDIIMYDGDEDMEIVYGDTDSLIFYQKGFNSQYIFGNQLGQMGYETDGDIPGLIDLLKVAGKKTYEYDYTKDDKYIQKYKMKGIPKNMQCYEAFDYIMENPTESVFIDTFRMVRNISDINSMYGIKELRSTSNTF